VSAKTGATSGAVQGAARSAAEAPAAYPADQLTDRDERFFAAELLREKLFEEMGEELPYRCEVRDRKLPEEGSCGDRGDDSSS
jgi:GTP-binding protein Era